jgi:hypothetical protein
MKTSIAIVAAFTALLASVTASAAGTYHEVYSLSSSSPSVIMGNQQVAATDAYAPIVCYTPTFSPSAPISGNATIIWDENYVSNNGNGIPTPTVEVNVTLSTGNTVWIVLDETCTLPNGNVLSTSLDVTPSDISGCYQIWENKKHVNTVKGYVYLLDYPIGDYFKFYDSSATYHYGGYITDRLDY